VLTLRHQFDVNMTS